MTDTPVFFDPETQALHERNLEWLRLMREDPGWALSRLHRLAELEEQLEAAQREVDQLNERIELRADEDNIYRVYDEEVDRRQQAEMNFAHAEAFIEHMDMGYRWAEWCEGRNP